MLGTRFSVSLSKKAEEKLRSNGNMSKAAQSAMETFINDNAPEWNPSWQEMEDRVVCCFSGISKETIITFKEKCNNIKLSFGYAMDIGIMKNRAREHRHGGKRY